MVGPIFNLFFKKCSSFNSKYTLSTIFVRFLVCSVYSVDRMYLELNEEHFKKRLKIGPTIQEILDFKVDTLKS